MKGETLDRRIRKTRRVIRQCLTELLKTKRIQDITVREISEKADINRGTFYLHYRDIFDLMEQIENELLEELEDVLNHFKASDLLSNPGSRLHPRLPAGEGEQRYGQYSDWTERRHQFCQPSEGYCPGKVPEGLDGAVPARRRRRPADLPQLPEHTSGRLCL